MNGLFGRHARRGLFAVALLVVTTPTALGAATLPPLTSEGWGELRIGMPERDAVHRFHLQNSDAALGEEGCREMILPTHPHLVVMMQKGRVARLSVYERGAFATDRGFKIGDREVDVHKAYGTALKVEPHVYADPPAHYLTSWTKPGKRGVRFETDGQRIGAIHVGTDAIEYVEGCL